MCIYAASRVPDMGPEWLPPFMFPPAEQEQLYKYLALTNFLIFAKRVDTMGELFFKIIN